MSLIRALFRLNHKSVINIKEIPATTTTAETTPTAPPTMENSDALVTTCCSGGRLDKIIEDGAVLFDAEKFEKSMEKKHKERHIDIE